MDNNLMKEYYLIGAEGRCKGHPKPLTGLSHQE